MIEKIEKIDPIKPLFKEYLNYMSQFFEINNYDSWCKGALKNIQLYSVSKNRHVYILKQSEFIVGFALINKHLRFNTEGCAIAEFYIQKEYKRKGYGRKLAEHVFSQFPGNWEVAVSKKNSSALFFWKKVISSYSNDKFIQKKHATFVGYGFIFNNLSYY